MERTWEVVWGIAWAGGWAVELAGAGEEVERISLMSPVYLCSGLGSGLARCRAAQRMAGQRREQVTLG